MAWDPCTRAPSQSLGRHPHCTELVAAIGGARHSRGRGSGSTSPRPAPVTPAKSDFSPARQRREAGPDDGDTRAGGGARGARRRMREDEAPWQHCERRGGPTTCRMGTGGEEEGEVARDGPGGEGKEREKEKKEKME